MAADPDELRQRILAMQAEYAALGGNLTDLTPITVNSTPPFPSGSAYVAGPTTPVKRKQAGTVHQEKNGQILAAATPSPSELLSSLISVGRY